MITTYKKLTITFEKEDSGWYGSCWVTPNFLACGYGENLEEMVKEVYESANWPEF
jgi:hypothetical protein